MQYPTRIPLLLVAAWAAAACTEPRSSGDLTAPALSAAADRPAPSPLVTVTAPAGSLRFWPYTWDGLSPISDPINLVFAGIGDARALRAALMFLDGDRTGFGLPDAFPFNCTWRDAMGDAQTAYSEPTGWAGNGIQLECGEYGLLRFHVRLFDAGDWTLGNAHLDLLIPGTADHQVLSWELPQQLVMVDALRTGLLDAGFPLFPSDPINDAPSFRSVPAVIYNGLPPDLRAAIGGPPDDVSEDWPLPNDGSATVFNVVGTAEAERTVARRTLTFEYNQVIPKPYCASGPYDYLYVAGPVTLQQQVVVTGAGNYISHYRASGHLDLTPVNVFTDPPTPAGETYQAVVGDMVHHIVTDQVTLASRFVLRVEIPQQGPFRGRLFMSLHVGPDGVQQYQLDVQCEP